MAVKTPSSILRQAAAQVRAAREEGEIEAPADRKRVYAEGVERPTAKRKTRTSAKRQVRANGGGVQRTVTYPFQAGDLVQIHTPPWQHRRAVDKGDIGMILEVTGGTHFNVQVGPIIHWFGGSDLRPLPDDMDEDDE
jgi:ribosomal protein L21E